MTDEFGDVLVRRVVHDVLGRPGLNDAAAFENGDPVAELESRLSAAEYREWLAFYSLDPWGDQRADMRMAQIMWSVIQPQTKTKIDANDYRLFPDEAHDLPEDVSDQEKEWMLKLNRSVD